MLFNKYQYFSNEIQKRGYSQNVKASNETQVYWVKWILGIEKSDEKAKMLSDKLRHLQKARHEALPDIVEYGFDEEQKAYAIVYEYLEDVTTFSDKVYNLPTQSIICGLIDLADCLNDLHIKFKIFHGDIHPENILIDKKGQFYLVDFGLADITKTFSQERDLEIFAKAFAAPEKFERKNKRGFPFQADIYSLGKVLEWFYDESQEKFNDEQYSILDKLLSEDPSKRPPWLEVLSLLKNLAITSETEEVQIAFRNGYYPEVLSSLNNFTPIFDLSPKQDENYILDIIVDNLICEGVIWRKDEDLLLFNKIKHLSELDQKTLDFKRRDGKKLPFKFNYTTEVSNFKADLTPHFQKWFEIKQKQKKIRDARKGSKSEFDFYSELLNEEKKVISKNSLRLIYTDYELVGDEISFTIYLDEKFSQIGTIKKHIYEGNAVDSEGFEYTLSTNIKKQNDKNALDFAGKPYDYDNDKCILKIKDCERLKSDSIPKSGFLFENTSKKEEEKNRQLLAINKAKNGEVQNPDLIYYLFAPDKLPDIYQDYDLDKIWQMDKKGIPLSYSYNQKKAILNALYYSPLSVIQGPPGTGKTTVITEIVFQILAIKPDAKILITSQTNTAVDQVLENLIKNEIPILRLSGITQPKIPVIRKHTLDKKLEGWKIQVKEAAEKNFSKLKKNFFEEAQTKNPFANSIIEIVLTDTDWSKKKAKIENIVSRIQNLKGLHVLPVEKEKAIEKIDTVLKINLQGFLQLYELHRDWVVTINSLNEKSALNQKLVDSIRVIGATCNHIAAKKYSKANFEFDYVIMDESGKATTAEALVPIIMGKNLIFVGDHRQLKPMLTSSKEVESWLRNKYNKEAAHLENWDDYFSRPSLFEQVISNINFSYKSQLTECRRSSKDQILLTSQCFYEHLGDEAIEPVDRPIEDEHNLPLKIKSSIFFIDIGSHYKSEKDDKKSSINKASAEVIPRILENLNQFEAVKNYSIGVITGYTAQHRLLNRNINKLNLKVKLNNLNKWKKSEDKLTVSVVDRFQGLERDIIIVDLVKSGPDLNLGFMEVPNRINVALSRQKKLLIIVGDYHGILSAKTSDRINNERAVLQNYLEKIQKNWIIKAEDLNELFK